MTTPQHQQAAGGAEGEDVPTTQTVLRNIRKSAAPYLPPPLLNVIHKTDSYLLANHATRLPSEPSMSILTAFFSAFIALRLIQGLQLCWLSKTKRSTAHLSGEENNAVLSGLSQSKTRTDNSAQNNTSLHFDETVVIIGASGAGKTVLLHFLSNENDCDMQLPMTVTSLVANVGFMHIPCDNTHKFKNKPLAIRLVDYPGHPSLSTQLTSLLLPDQTARIVFAIDATKPVTDGVSILYKFIFTNNKVRIAWKKSGKPLVILIVCTKEDDKKAKNHKRMKIQIRNELDRLRKVDSAIDMTGNAKGKSIDLENPDMPQLHFVETGIGIQGGNGLKAVREFVRTGAILEVL